MTGNGRRGGRKKGKKRKEKRRKRRREFSKVTVKIGVDRHPRNCSCCTRSYACTNNPARVFPAHRAREPRTRTQVSRVQARANLIAAVTDSVGMALPPALARLGLLLAFEYRTKRTAFSIKDSKWLTNNKSIGSNCVRADYCHAFLPRQKFSESCSLFEILKCII